MLKKEVGSSEDDILRTEDYSYVSQDEAEQLPFGNQVGSEIHDYSDPLGSYNRPLRSSVTTQQAATFSRRNVSYDVFARPTSVSLDSSLSPGKTEALTYWDNRAKWVIGQLRTVTCIAPAACKPTYAPNGLVESQTDYDADAQPIRQYRFGKLQQSRTYHADGTLATLTDGAGNTTTVDGWKRGIPQAITYPATPESPDGSSRTAWVDGNGWIQWTQDEYGFRTCYDYDAMGRLNRITYPSESQYRCDESAWAPTTITLADGYPAAYGVPAGHWRQTILAGNERHVVILDALFRPIVEQSLDLGNVSPTMTEVFNRYDAGGRQAFRSYPMNSGGKAVYSDTTLDGAHTSYDALDRVTRVDQDSELGVLRTQTDYLDGFLTRVTDPRSYRTWTSYMAYDEPTTQWPVGIQAAHATSSESDTDISRDPFGKPTAVTRHNLSGSVSATRRYVYDAAQELCKAIEPETGSALQHFDAAGNVDWTAAGLDLPSTASCDYTAASVAARKVVRSYDTRNRLLGLGFPDGIGNQLWTYTRDGLPRTITTYNSPNAGTPVVNTYSYGHRRLLDSETMTQPGAAAASIGYEYDANGHLQSQTYPDGRTVDYVPNALGQATRAGWEGASNPVVWGATYYANGAVGHFSYGNGIRHWMIQNTRGLPDRVQDADDAGVAVHDDSYDYDANGNVAAISDGLSSAERGGLPLGDRTMTYDGLNRLNTVVSPMYAPLAGNTARSYFDALDNIGHLVAPDRNLYYCYDEHWRLTNLKIDSCDGTSVRAFGYDAQGNVTNDNGRIYDFDFGNRLRSVSYNGSVIESYRYDGLGRRVLSSSPTLGDIRSLYSRDGQLLFQSNDRTGQDTSYTYFAGSLVGESVLTVATGTYANRFQFTDALGSPVAVTNGARGVLERSEYEPFGKLLNRPMTDGPGFTGHEDDAATGLSYMQQRYYDPGIGRFLSVDPVTANGNTGANFNRYKYASNNPYRFTDPDGRYDCQSNGGGPCSPQQSAQVDKYVGGISTAMKGLKPGSADYKALSAAQKYLGKAWDGNGVKIVPTALPKNTLANAGPDGQINIDLKQVAASGAKIASSNPSVANDRSITANGAGTIGHEARHELDAQANGWPQNKAQEYRTELNAYGIDGAVGRGMGVNTGYSTPQDVASGAQQSTDTWCANGGNCK